MQYCPNRVPTFEGRWFYKKSHLDDFLNYWNQLLWLVEIINPSQLVIRHLDYPLGWNIIDKQKGGWAFHKVT